MWEEMILNNSLSVLRIVLKNEKKKRQFRNICLKIYQALQTAFAGDEEFQK